MCQVQGAPVQRRPVQRGRQRAVGRLLHAAYFVVPHPKPSEQFHYFKQIFAFLMRQNNFSFEAPEEFDDYVEDPNTTVANMIEVWPSSWSCNAAPLLVLPVRASAGRVPDCAPVWSRVQALRRARISFDYSQVAFASFPSP